MMSNIRWNILKRCPKSGKIVGIDKKSIWYRLFLPLLGFAALIWFLVRVVPKPTRAGYPCQQVAMPLAATFIAWIAAATGIVVFGKQILTFVRAHWMTTSQICIVALFMGTQLSTSCVVDPAPTTTTTTLDGWAGPSGTTTTTLDANTAATNVTWNNLPEGTTPSTIPVNLPTANVIGNVSLYSYGETSNKVVWAHDKEATSWTGSGNWWNSVDQTEVTSMLENSLLELSGQTTASAAWDTLFKSYQTKKGLTANGYQAGQKIAIKLNMNGVDKYAYTGNACFVSPQMAYALLKQLVGNAGVAASDIYLYDATRYIPNSMYSLCTADPALAGVHYVDFVGTNGREKVVAGTQIVWSKPSAIESDPPKGRGQNAFLPTIVTGATYHINFSSLKAHDLAGMTVTGKNWFGSIMSGGVNYAPDQAGIHPTVAALPYNVPGYAVYPKSPMGSYNAIVDLMAHRDLGGKTFLYLVDGLFAVSNQNASVTTAMKWKQTVFKKSGQDWWPSSLLASQDAVAIDSIGFEMLANEESMLASHTLQVGNTAHNYLKEAAAASSPPSGTVYKDGYGATITQSLGTIVHWNGAD